MDTKIYQEDRFLVPLLWAFVCFLVLTACAIFLKFVTKIIQTFRRPPDEPKIEIVTREREQVSDFGQDLIVEDVVETLETLGYSKSQAGAMLTRGLARVGDTYTLEELLVQCLKK